MLCECGCGQEVKTGNRFIRWHHSSFSGAKNPMFGRHHSEEARRKNRASHLGKRFSEETKKQLSEMRLGKPKSEVMRRNLSNARLGIPRPKESNQKQSDTMKRNWQDPEYVRRQWNARNIIPNKAEGKLQRLFDSLNLPYKFVGDGQLIIGGKCPDFVNVNGQKKLIELFGDYWHKPEEEQDRIEQFRGLGFSTLIVWGSELSDVETLTQKILLFEGVASDREKSTDHC